VAKVTRNPQVDWPVVPTYEYTCRDCGHTFDIVQSMTDDPLTMCPECGGSLRKVFAPPAISFKGSGFYATDHGKKSKKPDGEKPTSDATSGKDGSGNAGKDGKASSGSKGDGSTSSATGSDRSAPATKEPAPK
jgi:putative FmdB family regulatory protein